MLGSIYFDDFVINAMGRLPILVELNLNFIESFVLS